MRIANEIMRRLIVGTVLIALFALDSLPQPARDDSGNDGVPESWKLHGMDYTASDGSKHHLELKGAGPGHHDILVWIDWMGDNASPSAHNHRPVDSAIQAVQTAYAASALKNSDGTSGANLMVVVSPDSVPHQATLGNGTEASIWSDFDKIRDAHFPKELKGVAHYCLFAHDLSFDDPTTSGLADIGGLNLIIALGEWDGSRGSQDEQTGAFLHELGHNMGLQHGGSDGIIRKPNYLSVMNYAFQADGLLAPRGKSRFDYSHFSLPDLDEQDLDETTAMSTDSALSGCQTLFFCPGSTQVGDPVAVTAPIDWNCDGVYEHHVAAHISQSQKPSLLHGFSDWDHIQLAWPVQPTSTPSLAHVSAGAELTLTTANRVALPPVTGLAAISTAGAVILAWDPLPQSRVIGYKLTRTDDSGTHVLGTSFEPRFVDSTRRQGKQASYAVQALYVPHGTKGAATLVKGPTGESLLSRGGTITDLPALWADVLDNKTVAALRRDSSRAIDKWSKDASAMADVFTFKSAVQARLASLVLATKPAAVTLR